MLLRDKMDVMMQELENELDESWERVDAEKLGLDSRADCSRMWASDEGIATAGFFGERWELLPGGTK